MNIFDLIVNCYGSLNNINGVPYWVMTPLRRVVRTIAHNFLPGYLSRTHSIVPRKSSEIIISFTSFPARINEVWQVVECMKRQTLLPEKIILWLSKEQFPEKELVPQSLWDRVDDLFSIRFVDGDIRSHKKYYYVSKEYPNKLIFLIDDDIYYPSDLLENVYNTHLSNPNAVVCNYGYTIKFDKQKNILPYKQWLSMTKPSFDSQLFFGSGGGTLFRPSELYKDLVDCNLAIQLAPLADDIWLNAMTRLAKRPIILLFPRFILSVKNKNNVKLCSENVFNGGNDQQIKAVSDYYLDTLGINPFVFNYTPINL